MQRYPSFLCPGLLAEAGGGPVNSIGVVTVNDLQGKNIGVLMGGLSAEREVSLVSGNAVVEAIQRKGLKALAIDVDRDVALKLKSMEIDLAFIALHGTYGEDGTVQGVLEYLGIPYTGSGVLGSSIAYNKVVSKQLFLYHDIPTAEHEVHYKKDRQSLRRKLNLPVVVKPSDQGSSFGVSIVQEENEWEKALELAFSYSEEIIVERFIEGRLITLGMREEEPMPIVEIKPKSGFYDYEAKYTKGKTQYICPAELSDEEKNICQDIARKVYRILKGRGFSRIDFILDRQGTPYVLEMNTIPGMTATSLLPMSARGAGLEFDDLVIEVLKTAQLDYRKN